MANKANRVSGYYGSNGSPVLSAASSTRLFGTSLIDTMTTQKRQYPDINIPLFLHHGFRYIIQYGLCIEGIFRIAGTKEKVKQLQTQLDRGETIDYLNSKVDPVDLADLMKIYFRELPDCLLQSDQYDHFINLLTLDRLGQIQKLRELVSNLRPENKEMLKELVWFLGKIAINANLNKMHEENLGLVWGPNLLWKGGKAYSTTDMMELMAGAGKIKMIVTLLVEEQDHIFNNINTPITNNSDMKISFIHKLSGYKKTLQGICIVENTENKSIWTADSGGVLKIFNSNTYAIEKEMDTNLGRIHSMTSIGEYAWIASSQSVSVWNKNGEMVKEFPGFHVSLAPVYSHGECRIWAGTEQKITIFSANNLEVVQTIDVPGQFLVSLTEIFGDSNQVWAGATNGVIYVFDKTSGTEIKQLRTPARRNITCLTFHRYNDAGKVWAGSEDKLIFVIDPASHEIVQTISHPDLLLINSLKSISNSVWSCSRDSSIRIWDSKSLSLIGSLDEFHTDAVTDAVLTWNSRKLRWELWSASFDKTVCIWSINSDFLPPPQPSPFQ
ncbi:hypothetical protein CYY_004969 [Polysphondylium violaceum]|uniref:Rho-GAP domain-containing protein n=1 Tax=Polysphondylium violaceum TaxID=133409 RepID=A0A8J4UYW9_9MYCE|nr:hypothetical protein CYY_004969 [Polysphondylium violaceum]